MKCKDCNVVDCTFRTTDLEKECQFKSSVIQVPYEWQYVRIQASIAAMQVVMNFFRPIDYNKATIAKIAVGQADALIEELKKK